jgi:predicted amidohydrolase
MRVALAQISPKLSRDNLKLHIDEIKKAKDSADLIIFPELSMSGYMLMDAVYEDSFELSELSEFEELSKDIDIIIGAVTKESHKIYNSALYFSNGTLAAIHHKNNLPNYGMFQEARFFFKGEGFELVESSFGKCMMVVCEDLWSSKTIDEVALKKPDFLFVIANSPSRDFSDEGLLGIEKQWTRILSTTAILSGAHVIFTNRVGFEDGLGFWGGSKVINPSGKIEKVAKLFERDLLFCEVDHNLSNIQKYLLREER